MGFVNQVGWLIHGAYVIGLCCSPERPTFTSDLSPVYEENIHPYRQPCLYCGKELMEPNCGVILFDNHFSLGSKLVFKEVK